MKLINKVTQFIAASVLAFSATNASAVAITEISGSLDVLGFAQVSTGSNPGATFLTQPQGPMIVNATGDFSPFSGQSILINDFTAANANNGFLLFSLGSASAFDFYLGDVQVVDPGLGLGDLAGNGLVKKAGYLDTNFSWSISEGIMSMFNANVNTTGAASVSEPASIALIGLGMVGLIIARRKAG